MVTYINKEEALWSYTKISNRKISHDTSSYSGCVFCIVKSIRSHFSISATVPAYIQVGVIFHIFMNMDSGYWKTLVEKNVNNNFLSFKTDRNMFELS